MKYQRFYDRLPVLFQHVMATGYGYDKRRERFGAAYRSYRGFLTEAAGWSRADLEAHQARLLREFIAHAVRESPFYRELYAEVDWEGVHGPADIERLPVVTKEMVRANMARVPTVERAGAVVSKTGGTTGTSLEVLITVDDYQRRMATLDHFKALHGYEHLRMRRATFSGKHIVPTDQESGPYWRYNHAMKQMLYSSFHVTPANAPAYVESLRRFRPRSIDGFVTTIFDLAVYMVSQGIRADWEPVAVFPTSETVTAQHRDVIEEAFGCPVRDQYASSEGAPFVYECAAGSLHYDLLSGVIEPGKGDGILVTSFTTHGTPLIRYAIGDMMTFAPEPARCPCGWEAPLVSAIEGRVSDALVATNGARVNLGNVANIFKTLGGDVKAAQVIQEGGTELRILVVLDPAADPDGVRSEIVSETRHKFGRDMGVRVEAVEEIPRERSGKTRLAVNRIGDR